MLPLYFHKALILFCDVLTWVAHARYFELQELLKGVDIWLKTVLYAHQIQCNHIKMSKIEKNNIYFIKVMQTSTKKLAAWSKEEACEEREL